jgi:hypothetical protein
VAVTERNRGVEVCRNINGGVDSGISATQISDTQFAKAFNLTFRGGEPTCRPGWTSRPLNWGVADDLIKWNTGLFQGAEVFILDNGTPYLVVSVGGNIFAIRTTDWTASWLAGGNSSLIPKVWMQQAEDVIIIQDGQSRPYIWDGANIRRAGILEVPTGTAMAYGRGRLWVARIRSYIGGDLVYGDATFGRRNILRFTENTFLNEGGEFAVPVKDSRITSLAFVARQDEGTKEGGLMVFTPGSIFEFEAPMDRTVWKNMEQPLQRFALIGFGSLGADCVGNVNGDLWFRSEDGIRSFYFGQRLFNSWGNTPQSTEMTWILNNDTVSMLYHASSVNFDNRFLTTALPYYDLARGYVSRGFSAIDFTGISALRRTNPPAWEGFWAAQDDLPIFKLLAADTRQGRRCWALVLNDGLIEVSELSKSLNYDNDLPISWWYETRDFDWQDDTEKKRLSHAEQWHREARGIFTTNILYRSDEQPCWLPIRDWQECIMERQCAITLDEETCLPPPMKQPVSLPRRGSTQPEDTQNCSELTPNRTGYTFQFRFENTGSAKVKRLKFVAEKIPEDGAGKIIPSNDCGGPLPCLDAACCSPSQYKSP